MGWAKEAIALIQDKWIVKTVYYMISSKYRQSIKVHEWLKSQLIKHKDILEAIIEKEGWVRMDDDYKVVQILKYVNKNIKYVSDSVQYKEIEHWAEVDETLASKKGDCEDGATLLFCLCRLAGIPADKIRLAAGDVVGGGHAWVRYASDRYPFVAFYLDWCYYPNLKKIPARGAYFDFDEPIDVRYIRYWFTANDESGFGKFKW